MNCRTIVFANLLILLFINAATAQILKPKEIIYSRVPSNMNAPPNGANSPTIWVVGQDGSNDRQITTGTKPRISDDGRFLLFNRFTRAPSYYDPFGGYADFVVRDLKTGQETVIIELSFNTMVGGLSFSPESNQGEYEIIADNSCFLYKFNRDGSNIFRFPWEVADYCNDDFPSVRRGGDQLIAFSNNIPTTNVGGLYTVGITGASRQRIPNTSCRDFHPAWSNDNQYIAFGSIALNCFNSNYPTISLYPYWIANIFKIKPDGTGRQQLTNFPANPDCALNTANCLTLGYVWTEDNSKIIAAGRIDGVKGLFALNTDGNGSFTQIPISAGNAPEFVGAIVQPRVEQNVLSLGGGVAASAQYTLVSTIGEPIAGQTSTGGTYSLSSGFWATFAATKKTPFDFDGDGKTDIGIFRPSSGAWWLNSSSTNETTAIGFGSSTDKLVPADYTGDGKTDVAFYRPSSGQWFILRSEDFSFYGFPFGSSTDIPTPGDFDGDGKTDAAVFRPSNSGWYILRSSDGGVTTRSFGVSEDQPVAADYDGDSKADLAIFRPSTSAWWLQKSSDNSIYAVQFGQNGDKTAQGDYTGDGKTDIAFYRPSTGFWYILRSEDLSFYGFPFGASEDLPVSGDYDGDGKFDAAVFRPSNAGWYLLRTTAGFSAVQFGLTGDNPIPNSYVR